MFAARDRAAEILGNRFRIVRNGLDEGEVSACLDRLTGRNQDLARELERLQAVVGEDRPDDSFGSTVPGSDATPQDEAARIIAEAERRADEIVQEKVAAAEQRADEVLRAAELSAEASMTEARREASDIVADARRRIEAAEGQTNCLLRDAEAQVESASAVAEEEAGRLVAEMRRKAEDIVRVRISRAEEEGRNIIEQAMKTAEAEAQRILEEAVQAPPASSGHREENAGEGSDDLQQEMPSDPPHAAVETSVESEGDAVVAGDGALYEGTVDLAIRPPIVLDRVVRLHRHLKKTPQVKVMDVGRSGDRGLRMRLLLPKGTPLIEVLKAFPEVKNVAVPREEAILSPHGLQPRDANRVRKVFVTTGQ